MSEPLTVAVIGSGPAGVYAADELIRGSSLSVRIDMYDRLPTPYGLVRYGVAPDHGQIKSVERALQRVLESPEVHFHGNVEVGRDVSLADLAQAYDSVVLATGAPRGNRLGIAGEDGARVHTAAEVVGWYSGHPDSYAMPISLEGAGSAVVVGAGNVALDIARVLTKPAQDLAATDVPEHVLEALSNSQVRTVHIVCRRGPDDAKFSAKELRELVTLPGVGISIHNAEERTAPVAGASATVKVLDELARNTRPSGECAREIRIHFWRRPVGFSSTRSGTRVLLERTDGEPGPVEELEADLTVAAIGFGRVPLPGLPADPATGAVRHDQGRVIGENGLPMPGVYVAGWAKRGPSGVIGTNRADAAETVRSVLEDLTMRAPRPARPTPVASELRLVRTQVVTYEGWQQIDSAEVERGRRRGASRVKIPDWRALLAVGTNLRKGSTR